MPVQIYSASSLKTKQKNNKERSTTLRCRPTAVCVCVCIKRRQAAIMSLVYWGNAVLCTLAGTLFVGVPLRGWRGKKQLFCTLNTCFARTPHVSCVCACVCMCARRGCSWFSGFKCFETGNKIKGIWMKAWSLKGPAWHSSRLTWASSFHLSWHAAMVDLQDGSRLGASTCL